MFGKEKFEKCPTCGEFILENAPMCLHCGTQVKRKFSSRRIIFICVCLVLSITCFTWAIISLMDSSSSSVTGGSAFKDTTISMSEFNKIKTGMTYDEVVVVVGCKGELMSEVDIGYSEYATKIYSWEGNGYAGSNANVTFQGGKVVSKAQIGLE